MCWEPYQVIQVSIGLTGWIACREQPYLRRFSLHVMRVELTSMGPLAVAPSPAMPRVPGIRAPRARDEGPKYVYRCTVCRKTFNKRTMDGNLNPHKNLRGYPCPGRYGVYVRAKY